MIHTFAFWCYLLTNIINIILFFSNFRPRVPSGDILDSSTSHHIHHPESHNISHLQLTVTPAQERTPRVTNAPLSPLLVSSRRRRRTRTLQKPSSTMTSIRYVKVFNFWKCDSSFQKQFVFVLETAFLDDFGNLDQPNLSLSTKVHSITYLKWYSLLFRLPSSDGGETMTDHELELLELQLIATKSSHHYLTAPNNLFPTYPRKHRGTSSLMTLWANRYLLDEGPNETTKKLLKGIWINEYLAGCALYKKDLEGT